MNLNPGKNGKLRFGVTNVCKTRRRFERRSVTKRRVPWFSTSASLSIYWEGEMCMLLAITDRRDHGSSTAQQSTNRMNETKIRINRTKNKIT